MTNMYILLMNNKSINYKQRCLFDKKKTLNVFIEIKLQQKAPYCKLFET